MNQMTRRMFCASPLLIVPARIFAKPAEAAKPVETLISEKISVIAPLIRANYDEHGKKPVAEFAKEFIKEYWMRVIEGEDRTFMAVTYSLIRNPAGSQVLPLFETLLMLPPDQSGIEIWYERRDYGANGLDSTVKELISNSEIKSSELSVLDTFSTYKFKDTNETPYEKKHVSFGEMGEGEVKTYNSQYLRDLETLLTSNFLKTKGLVMER